MVDVSNKHKNITVEVSNKHKSFTVEVENKSGNTNITASPDTSQYWANQSHTFADQAKESVQEAKNYAELANSYIEGFENVVTNNTNNIIATGNDYINQITETKNAGIEEITTAKDEAVNSVTTARSEAINNITTTKTTILQDIEFVADGEKKEIQELADEIKDSGDTVNIAIEAGVERLNSIDALKKSQITNCITEIPQRIKLELKDSVLTLKAGSKVIVPNGFEADGTTPKFDEVLINRDSPQISAGVGEKILFVTLDGSTVYSITLGKAVSDATDSLAGKTWHAWYDITNNIIQRYGSNAGTYRQVSFPIAITTFSDDNTCSSIDQVFNGIGYIGSTIWVDKGVKGLIPNGRNEDGTLNNIEFTTSEVITLNIPDVNSRNNTSVCILYDDGFKLASYTARYGADSIAEDGFIYSPNGQKRLVCELAVHSTEAGTNIISSFQPKLPFRAVDWNEFNTLNNNALLDSDKSEISGWGMPSNKYIDLTLGASGTTYTAPANGWFHISKGVTGTNQYVNLRNTNTEVIIEVRGPANNTVCACYIPAKKGDVVACTYSASGTLKSFRFTYAEGEV